MGCSRPEYWSELPFPSLGDLPDPGIEPGSPALQPDTLPSESSGKPPHFPSAVLLAAVYFFSPMFILFSLILLLHTGGAEGLCG